MWKVLELVWADENVDFRGLNQRTVVTVDLGMSPTIYRLVDHLISLTEMDCYVIVFFWLPQNAHYFCSLFKLLSCSSERTFDIRIPYIIFDFSKKEMKLALIQKWKETREINSFTTQKLGIASLQLLRWKSTGNATWIEHLMAQTESIPLSYQEMLMRNSILHSI